MVPSFACARFVSSAPAENVAKGASEQKPVADVKGNDPSLRGNSIGIGSGGNPTGEGALSIGNCIADTSVYNKDGKFFGRGIVSICY